MVGGVNDNLPYFDKIQQQGISFTNFVANGCTSDTAHIGFFLGIEPLKLVGSNISPYSGYTSPTIPLPEFMNKQGYVTTFISSVSLDFLDQGTFISGIQFSHIINDEAFSGQKTYVFDAAPDHVLYNKSLDIINKQQDPYFITLQNISFHKPYNTPYGKTKEDALRYADKSLYYFYIKLKQQKFFDNGILIIMGDHRKMEPLEKHEKEAIGDSWHTRTLATIIGTGIPSNKKNNNIIQHTDFFYSLKKFVASGTIQTSKIYNDIFSSSKQRNRGLVCCRNNYKNKNTIAFENKTAISLINFSPLKKTNPFIYNYISSYLDFQYGEKNIEKDKNDLVLIAHRGSPLETTENSLKGFFLAKQHGADGIEFDVSWTKDKQNIVMHGEGLYSTICGNKKKVTNYTLEYLQKNCPLTNGETVRTLEDILQSLDGLFDYYFLELKVHDPKHVEEQTIDTINTVKKLHMQDKVIFISYDNTAKYIIGSNTDIIAGRDTFDINDFSLLPNFRHQYYMIPKHLVTDTTIQDTKELGKEFVTYTVNTTGELEQLYNQGVRIFMTDNVPLLQGRAEKFLK